MLHIHNGDSAANVAKQTALPGEHFAFREALLTGPTPAEFKSNGWRLVRARHLCEAYGVDLKQALNDLRQQDEKLATFREHEEVVLWFEHDLFCQLHLIYLLDWFGQQHMGETKLSLVCIDKFPGRENFRGLGELTPQEFASLFPVRQPVTSIQSQLATAAWGAYCSPDPTHIEIVLTSDTSALPFLNAALRAHLERFPATTNGLSRIENSALQSIHDGVSKFSELFLRFVNEEPVYGLGDAQFWLALRRLSGAFPPLLEIAGVKDEDLETQLLTPKVVRTATFELSHLGESTLNGESDFVALNGIDLWLGGVHLHGPTGSSLWRWDATTESLRFL
ncbi:MAG TPA: hypothetical protein VGO56_08090 [Pyrinomonadaceae bacterium]|jgi:hypothetical protein|nr:hypothetical protein [Pyrinomonadaceae bacterium]